MKELHLVLTYHWYDKIECGDKTHEFRAITPYWLNRLLFIPSYKKITEDICSKIKIGEIEVTESNWNSFSHVTFHRAYTNTTMSFEINSFKIALSPNNDLGIPAIDIELGKRIKH